MSFVVGDKVTWKSQAAGSWKTKVGTVVEVVRAGATPKTIRHLGTRKVESYVVEVTYKPNQRGQVKKPERYWPVASGLEKARA